MPNLLTWGGVLLMIVGGVIAYPSWHEYLIPPDAQSLEFSVTSVPPPAAVLQPTLQPEPSQPSSTGAEVTATNMSQPSPSPEVEATRTPIVSTESISALQTEDQVASATAPPPLVLPETEVITPTVQSELGLQPEVEATPVATAEATPTPTVTPTPWPTIDPASLVPSRLVIQAIGLDAPIVEVGWETQEVNGQQVSSWIVPDSFAAGWHKTTAPPGRIGNTVLNGHHNINGEVFRYLVDLQPGDEVVVYTGETPHYYSVTELHILKEKGQPVEVRMQNAQWILPTQDERLTMVTCWPYTNNTHRLIVVARPVQPTPNPVPVE